MPRVPLIIKWLAKHYCLLLLLIAPGHAYAQTANVNELEQKLKQTLPDTTRLHLLIKLTEAYTSVDPEKKLHYTLVYKKLAEKLLDEKAIANAYLSIGVYYATTSKMDSALKYFNLAYNHAVKTNYLIVMGKSLSDIGFVYDQLDNKNEAIKYYFQALEVLKKVNYIRGINQCYINIGSIYFDMQQYKLAETYYSQCLKSYTDNKDEAGIGYALFTMGSCYQSLGQLPKAMEYLTKSLAIRQKLGDVNGIALVRKALGRTYTGKKQYDLAVATLTTALKTVQGLNNKYEEAAIDIDLADAYLAKKDYDSAKFCALKSLAICRVIKSKTGVSESLEKLVAVYKNKHDIPKAFKYQSEYVSIQDSILIEKTLKDVSLAEVSRMRSENASLAKDNQLIVKKNTNIAAKLHNYSNTIVTTSVVLVFAILLLLILYRRNLEKQATNKLLLQQKEEIASINHELETLNEELNTQMELTSAQNAELEKLNGIKNKFFSIISHDLRGPIGTLQSLLSIYHDGDIGKKEFNALLFKLEDTILTTGAFLDNLLEWSKNQLEGMLVKPVNFNLSDYITENIHLCASKIELKKLKVINGITEPAMVYADQNMINLVVRNLLSNSIKFCNPEDEISFSIQQKDNRVIMALSDTGPGINEANIDTLFSLEHTLSSGTQGEKGNNLGLILCRDMIIQNQGTIRFETEQGKGTTFWVNLPAANNAS